MAGANAAGDMDRKPAWSGRGSRICARVDVDIGAAGAATVARADNPKFTVTLNGAGTYDVVYPACKNVGFSVQIISAAKTVVGQVQTAENAGAGTLTFKTLNAAGADTNPANGDKLRLYFELDSENV